MSHSPGSDDHLPPEPQPRSARRVERNEAPPPPARGPSRWGDRVLFAAGGLVLGFTVAYLYLEKNPNPVPSVESSDPHAGVAGVGPGATRDLPGAGGGSPPITADPAARQRLAELTAAVAKAPADYDLLVKLGNAAYDAEDPRQAIDAYERALKVKDGDANVLTDLGVSYRNLGDVDRALGCFERALKTDPKHWPALFNQAIVYGIDRGDPARARGILARLKKEHPEIPALDKLAAAIEDRAKEPKK